MVSTGLLPIKKAYVKFSVKSVLPPAAAKAVSDIYTEPKEGGDDPNIRTTIKFQVKIPNDPEYCPRMTCTAYDMLYLAGMAQPILGSFTLKLGDILRDTREKDAKVQEDVIKMTRIVKQAVELKKGKDQNLTLL